MTCLPGLVLIAAVLQSGNLVRNSDFQAGLTGWGELYTRTPGMGSVALEDGREGHKVAAVNSRDAKDWAFSQGDPVPIRAGEIVEISGWLKTSAAIDAKISVVARDAANQVLDWEFGAVGSVSAHDWQFYKRRFVLPSSCATAQFRLVGVGQGEVWLDQPAMVDQGNVSAMMARGMSPVRLESKALSVTVGTDGSISTTDKRDRREWVQRPGATDLIVKGLSRLDPEHARLDLYNVGSDQGYSVSISLDPALPEITTKISGSGALDTDFLYPGPMGTKKGDWLIEPLNEGILYRADDPTAPAWKLVTYGGHGLCMPWYGIEEPATGVGAMAIIQTPNDSEVSWDRDAEGVLEPRPVWQPTRHTFGYERSVRWCFFPSGGYVAQAKRYRAYAKEIGLFKTLRTKLATCEGVDRLVGAVNVWNWDMDVVDLGNQLSQLGIKRVLWSRGGTPEELNTLNDLGFLTSRYDIYQDVWDPKIALSWMNTKGWPDDLVLLENGDWMKGWAHPDKQADGTIKWIQGGVICSEAGLARAKVEIPEELKTHPYLCRFIDTTTASPFRECYNPKHPLSRGDDRKYKMGLLDFISNQLHLVTGSETGLDASVPYLEYFEGMMSLGPYRLPDSGTDMLGYRTPTPDFLKYQVGSYYRLPLWELVYHDCTVAQWYWGDATNKAREVWDNRDLLNILYGTAPLLAFDKAEWGRDRKRMLQTYRNVCSWTREVGWDEMVSHEFLTEDHTVQRTRFSSGRSVIANFGSQAWSGGGVTVPAGGFLEGGK